MVKVVSFVEREVRVVAQIVPSVRTYDVTTSDMSDDCLSYRVAGQAAMWLTQDGVLAEIECIYPDECASPMCIVPVEVPTRVACPVLVPGEEGPLWVARHGTAFTIWLARDKVVDQAYRMTRTLELLAAQGELVGIAVAHACYTLYGPEPHLRGEA